MTTFKEMAIQIAHFQLAETIGQDSIEKLKSGEIKLVDEFFKETSEGKELIEALEAYQRAKKKIQEFVKKHK